MNDVTSCIQGQLAEDRALEYLESHRLRLVERNYRTRSGEIDLIMQDEDILVFVEVRARQKNLVMEAVETITPNKIRRLVQTAELYLQQAKTNYNCRFDVIGISGPLEDARIDWIKNAFEA